MDKKKIALGFIVLLFSTYGIYLTLNNDVRIYVTDDDTRFYVPHEDYPWIWSTAGVEKNRLMDGTSLMYRSASDVEVNTTYSNETNEIWIVRTTPYIRGPVVKDTYYFDGDIEDKELFPVSHTIEIYNASGKYYRYTADDLTDTGDKRKLTGETYLKFGKNMDLELQFGYRWAWIGWPYGSDSVSAQYDIDSDYEVYEIRLFDPLAHGIDYGPRTPENGTWLNYDSISIDIDLNCTNFSNITYNLYGELLQ